ncbi:hypothetical protein AMTRI_Chr09g38410 [Amborella trichopoda]|uniref:Uncharacterized protein n=1 Tax=Amborella trichopoda TaxID=13333 RepID=W1P0E8_AMBTC|nr:hypothetical protein AMTR_s00100p00068910 [Amborella trichopoda]
MKRSGVLVASAVAASATALTACGESKIRVSAIPNEEDSSSHGPVVTDPKGKGNEKFEPRFDGLRFIETLVTAHR